MNFGRNLIILLFLIGCTTPSGIDQKDVTRVLQKLSSDEMLGRQVFTSGNQKAATFIAQEFAEIGLEPYVGDTSFFQTFEDSLALVRAAKVFGKREYDPGLKLSNVVGQIKGKRKDEIVLFSAHYDHIGIKDPVQGDSVCNGANDDASGVTAVIELARYFKQKGVPERTLIFVAFTAEEIGGFGSRYFSKQLEPGKVVAMLNIEMIGKVANKGLNSSWMTGWDKSDLGEIMQDNLKGSNYELYPDPYPKYRLFYRSDNATLARLGVPAHSISTTQIDVDTDYHQVSDEIETLNIENITRTIQAIAIGTKGIVNGEQTPTRIDTEDVK